MVPRSGRIPWGTCIRNRGAWRSEIINFQKGQFVHHPKHGVGQIQSIDKRSFGGQEEATYAQVFFERDGLTMMLLMRHLAKAVRQLISEREARQVLAHLKKWDGPIDQQWKSRAAANQEAIDQGDPFEYAKVVKSLTQLQAKRELRQQDRSHLQHSLECLTEELAQSLGQPLDEMRHLITEASVD